MLTFNTLTRSKGLSTPQFEARVKHNPIDVAEKGKFRIPNHVRIPFIEGDGIGPEIMKEAQRVVNTAVKLSYGKDRSIYWVPMAAGEKAIAAGQEAIPQKTIQAIRKHHFFVKGPLNTPTGGGFRSINVQLRKMFDLFACIRPVKNIPGVVTPMKKDQTDVVIFRENTEDVYKGVEYAKGSPEAQNLITTLNQNQANISTDSAIGIKPISESASKRLIQKAIDYALEHSRPSVTLVHKGNIMKYTEGAFVEWGKELAREKYPNQVIWYDDFVKQFGGDFSKLPKGKVVLQSRIADAMFQDAILNPQWHSVIATMNLNGDYLSDAFAATIGGLGLSPGANIGDEFGMFESTHGSAPDIAGQSKANPTALFLTMTMLLDEMGWREASDLVRNGIETCMKSKQMTGDLARQIPGTPALSTVAYTDAVIEAMKKLKNPTLQQIA